MEIQATDKMDTWK